MFFISIIGSFLGGMAALFAPCCVTILLPLYLGTIFKQRAKVFVMTVIFSLGLAAILVPISLGAGFLAQFLHMFHQQFYIFGGAMLLLTGIAIAFGMKIPMPNIKRPNMPTDGKLSWLGAFSLGIFSGIASACCAPVLAGSVTLAVLSGTFVKAFVVSMFYVIGMVIPLFILALFWNKFKISDLAIFRKFDLKIIAGIVFLIVGAMMFYLGITGNEWWAPVWQTGFATWLKDLNTVIVNYIRSVF